MKRPLRIISFPVDRGGCGWYRVRQPFAKIHHHTEHDCHIIDMVKDGMPAVTKAFMYADLVVGRPGSELGMQELRKQKEYAHLKFVLDIDDNVELVSPYSWHYAEYGLEEFYDRNAKKWLWRDGQGKFHLKANRARVAKHIEGLKEADLVTVTTERLATYVKQYNKNVAVLPNSLDLENWWVPDFKPKKKLRVGYAGGISHYEDLYSIKEPLNKLMRELDFEMYFVGSHFKGIVEEDNRERVTVRGWIPFKGHPFHMMSLDFDVMIIPLADLPFNHYKSSVKWYEAAAMGVPTVVANVIPYKDEITTETALTYNTPEEFYQALKTLLSDAQQRAKLGRSARKWVEKHRDATKNVNQWIEAYASIV